MQQYGLPGRDALDDLCESIAGIGIGDNRRVLGHPGQLGRLGQVELGGSHLRHRFPGFDHGNAGLLHAGSKAQHLLPGIAGVLADLLKHHTHGLVASGSSQRVGNQPNDGLQGDIGGDSGRKLGNERAKAPGRCRYSARKIREGLTGCGNLRRRDAELPHELAKLLLRQPGSRAEAFDLRACPIQGGGGLIGRELVAEPIRELGQGGVRQLDRRASAIQHFEEIPKAGDRAGRVGLDDYLDPVFVHLKQPWPFGLKHSFQDAQVSPRIQRQRVCLERVAAKAQQAQIHELTHVK